MKPKRQLFVEYLPIASLAPAARNSRTHSEEQLALIVSSMMEFGFTNPILIDAGGGIVAGHGRVLAALQVGMEKVPCIRLGWLTKAQRRAYLIADNQIPLNAGWDIAVLAGELQDLKDGGFDLAVLGFDSEFLAGILAPDEEPGDPDLAPALPEVAVSRPGDVWIAGSHRIACGDCTDAMLLEALMAGELADVCWTDPPYNVGYSDKVDFLKRGDMKKGKSPGARSSHKIMNDDMDDASFREFLGSVYRSIFTVLKPGASIYVAHAETERHNFTSQFLLNGFKLSGCLIWRKQSLVLGRSDYQWIHEPILYGWKKGDSHRWYGGRKKVTVVQLGEGSPFRRRDDGRWEVEVDGSVFVVDGKAEVEQVIPDLFEVERPTKSLLHPTMKPVALIEQMLANSSRRGEVVFDGFSGSGSTVIAAETLGLCARVCDKDPRYCDVTVKRWEVFSGRQATLEATGKTFADVSRGAGGKARRRK